jgi:arylsulfatase A-like enzyme
VDILPTFCGLMGLELPEGVQGMNLSHLALGEEGPEPEAAMMMICGATAAWEDGYEWRALRDKRYTYAVYRRDRKELLFDHVNDPYQLTNLMESPAHAATARAFQEHLNAKMTAIGDTFERCTYYRDRWMDGDRRILRSATHDWSHLTEL